MARPRREAVRRKRMGGGMRQVGVLRPVRATTTSRSPRTTSTRSCSPRPAADPPTETNIVVVDVPDAPPWSSRRSPPARGRPPSAPRPDQGHVVGLTHPTSTAAGRAAAKVLAARTSISGTRFEWSKSGPPWSTTTGAPNPRRGGPAELTGPARTRCGRPRFRVCAPTPARRPAQRPAEHRLADRIGEHQHLRVGLDPARLPWCARLGLVVEVDLVGGRLEVGAALTADGHPVQVVLPSSRSRKTISTAIRSRSRVATHSSTRSSSIVIQRSASSLAPGRTLARESSTIRPSGMLCGAMPQSRALGQRRPTAFGSWRTAWASARRSAPKSACGPSQSAFSGSGWTSTMTPSAPTAMAARESGTTRSRAPAGVRRVDDDRQVAGRLDDRAPPRCRGCCGCSARRCGCRARRARRRGCRAGRRTPPPSATPRSSRSCRA